MKLATALSERAAVQNTIEQLKARLANNAKVQEGESPAENPAELLQELDVSCRRLEALMAAINLTNSRVLAGGKTLTEQIAARDVLKLRLHVLRTFLENASATVDRYAKRELAIKSTVNVREEQKKLDALSKQLRALDETIQEANWTHELQE